MNADHILSQQSGTQTCLFIKPQGRKAYLNETYALALILTPLLSSWAFRLYQIVGAFQHTLTSIHVNYIVGWTSNRRQVARRPLFSAFTTFFILIKAQRAYPRFASAGTTVFIKITISTTLHFSHTDTLTKILAPFLSTRTIWFLYIDRAFLAQAVLEILNKPRLACNRLADTFAIWIQLLVWSARGLFNQLDRASFFAWASLAIFLASRTIRLIMIHGAYTPALLLAPLTSKWALRLLFKDGAYALALILIPLLPCWTIRLSEKIGAQAFALILAPLLQGLWAIKYLAYRLALTIQLIQLKAFWTGPEALLAGTAECIKILSRRALRQR